MSAIDKYVKMSGSRWGAGDFGTGKPNPFSVLSDNTRMAITVLLSLKGPLTAKQIAEELELSPSTVLDHLQKLFNAMIIKEVEVAEKTYKRERYYDIDIIPYFEDGDEAKEIDKRIGKYADILNETTRAVFEKCLSELSEYLNQTLMAKHGMTIERDDVKHFIWLNLMHRIEGYFSKQHMYKLPLETERRWFLYIGLKKDEGSETT